MGKNKGKEKNAKCGVKRGREEAEISSSAHPFCQTNAMSRWKRGRYIPIYLTLMDEFGSKTNSCDGFWVSFTAEFNKRVKESITEPSRVARFKDFKIDDVIYHGMELWEAYKEEKKNEKVVTLTDFHLYEKAFRHCDRFYNPSSFSKSGKRPRGSNCFTSTNRGNGSGSLETVSSKNNGISKEALHQLSHLRRSGKLLLEDVKEALNNFKGNDVVSYLWSQLSSEDQVVWIKGHL